MQSDGELIMSQPGPTMPQETPALPRRARDTTPVTTPGVLSSQALVVITAVLLIALVATIIISWFVWYTPPMEPLEIPRVEKG